MYPVSRDFVLEVVFVTCHMLKEDLAKCALGRICIDREELWRRCRESDSAASGLISRSDLCGALSAVCGEFDWEQLLQRTAPSLGSEVAYTELLSIPRVRWFYSGKTNVVSLAQGTVQGRLPLSGVLALFDTMHDRVVRPVVPREILRRLLPSMQDHQRHKLASEIFGDKPDDLLIALHKLVLLSDPIEFEEDWMKAAFRKLAMLTQKKYGAPLSRGLRRWFSQIDEDKDDHAQVEELVSGWLHLLRRQKPSNNEDSPPLDEHNLRKLGKAIQESRPRGRHVPISIVELLRVLDERPRRPASPSFPALEGSVPALLFLNKVRMLHCCHLLDREEQGQISARNFVELTSILASVVGRPLTGAARAALENELHAEEISYIDALSSFEVFAEGGPWAWGAGSTSVFCTRPSVMQPLPLRGHCAPTTRGL